MSLLIRNDDPSDGNRLSDNHKVLTWWKHRVEMQVSSRKITKNTRDQNKHTITITGYTHTHSFFTLIEIRLNIPGTDVKLCVCTHLVERTNETEEAKRPTTRKNNVAVVTRWLIGTKRGGTDWLFSGSTRKEFSMSTDCYWRRTPYIFMIRCINVYIVES